jgi:Asp-tRNA(Asn)/Glu-tRNA(Gln) amidotransferase A subunit family amidase
MTDSRVIERRAILLAGLAPVVRTARLVGAPSPPLETMTQWLNASLETRRQAIEACLGRIRDLEPSIQAWVQVAPQRPTGRGKLSEIPFGVKDVVETHGLATEYGSPIYKGRIGSSDAVLVRELRRRGAVLLGKTQTTAFSYRTPAPTRNPRDPRHTPGGSSSGSAAAVAAGMVPFTIGEQTRGSILRPASFCGITGFKPTFGLLPVKGVLPLAKSLDTLGFFTHTPADMLALWEALGYPIGRPEDFALGAPEPMPDVEPAMAAAFRGAVSSFREAGLSLRPIDMSEMIARLSEATITVMAYEAARAHRERYAQHGDRLADLAALVRDGLKISAGQYEETKRYIESSKARVAEWFKATPVILTPAAVGPAPLGLTSTGDPRMNAPWTALGTPAISIPMRVSGLPLGLQLTAAHGNEPRLLSMAVRLDSVLAAARR